MDEGRRNRELQRLLDTMRVCSAYLCKVPWLHCHLPAPSATLVGQQAILSVGGAVTFGGPQYA